MIDKERLRTTSIPADLQELADSLKRQKHLSSSVVEQPQGIPIIQPDTCRRVAESMGIVSLKRDKPMQQCDFDPRILNMLSEAAQDYFEIIDLATPPSIKGDGISFLDMTGEWMNDVVRNIPFQVPGDLVKDYVACGMALVLRTIHFQFKDRFLYGLAALDPEDAFKFYSESKDTPRNHAIIDQVRNGVAIPHHQQSLNLLIHDLISNHIPPQFAGVVGIGARVPFKGIDRFWSDSYLPVKEEPEDFTAIKKTD